VWTPPITQLLTLGQDLAATWKLKVSTAVKLNLVIWSARVSSHECCLLVKGYRQRTKTFVVVEDSEDAPPEPTVAAATNIGTGPAMFELDWITARPGPM